MKENTLSLCMIVKNEERYIKKSLDSVSDIVDEIIIVDTGSTDSTLHIIKNYNIKLYKFNWNNNFSAARNYTISKATCDWILFLDADEILDNSSKLNILNFIKNTNLDGCHFLVYNYISENMKDYTLHYALRLFKNNKGYYYKGKIHEQISNNNFEIIDKFSNEEIILHHFGYTSEVLKEKDKRARNIPILLDLLKENPNDSFTLFNLGNEYLAKNDLNKAIEYYTLSYKNINYSQHYSIHLLYRLSVCHHTNQNFKLAIKYIDDAEIHFNENVDFIYLKGCIYYDLGKYTLAIDYFNKCIELGDSKNTIKFINNCGSINPLLSLGDLYLKLSDYNKALTNYNKALSLDKTNFSTLYKIGEILNKAYEIKSDVTKGLLAYFADKSYIPNIILTIDILIKEKLFKEAENLINSYEDFEEYTADFNYLKGIVSFYNKGFNDSLYYFNNVIIEKEFSKTSNIVLNHIFSESAKYLFAISLLINNKALDKYLNTLKTYSDDITYSVLEGIYNIYTTGKTQIIKENTQLAMLILENFLDKFLLLQEFDIFQNLIEIYNYIEDKSILISLSKIYYFNGFKDMAKKNMKMSIKLFDYIDKEYIYFLYD